LIWLFIGVNLKDKEQLAKVETKIESKVKEIINKLKTTHEKFFDPDFGPNEKDEFGALSFYGTEIPAPAGSKYPNPESLRWERPIYDDSKFLNSGVSEEKVEVVEPEESETDEYDEYGSYEEEENQVQE
jgi:hypothetical protein